MGEGKREIFQMFAAPCSSDSTPVGTVKNPFLTRFSLCHMWNWSVASRDGARWIGHVKVW